MVDSTTSKEQILKKIRKASIQESTLELQDVDEESDIFTSSTEPLEIQFAQNFTEVSGKFIFFESNNELVENVALIATENKWKNIYCADSLIKEVLKKGDVDFNDTENDFLKTEVGITFCECLVARTGGIVVSSKLTSGRRLIVYPHIHVVIAYTSQLVYNIDDSLNFIKEKYGVVNMPSMVTTISGPSRTADIEKTLVQGAHGPKEVYLLLVDDTTTQDN
jgi:L-lactate dehydrogenase complex protein LldG